MVLLGLFDLDGFKRYNDTFGHPAGDALLRRLGSQLQAAVEPVGRAYRMGGDEFCILVRGPRRPTTRSSTPPPPRCARAATGSRSPRRWAASA